MARSGFRCSSTDDWRAIKPGLRFQLQRRIDAPAVVTLLWRCLRPALRRQREPAWRRGISAAGLSPPLLVKRLVRGSFKRSPSPSVTRAAYIRARRLRNAGELRRDNPRAPDRGEIRYQLRRSSRPEARLERHSPVNGTPRRCASSRVRSVAGPSSPVLAMMPGWFGRDETLRWNCWLRAASLTAPAGRRRPEAAEDEAALMIRTIVAKMRFHSPLRRIEPFLPSPISRQQTKGRKRCPASVPLQSFFLSKKTPMANSAKDANTKPTVEILPSSRTMEHSFFPGR